MNVFLYLLEDGSEIRITEIDDRDIPDFFWGNDQTIVYLRDEAGDENFHLFSVDIKSHKSRSLTPFEGCKVLLYDELKAFENEMIIGINKRVPEVFDAYRINIESGDLQMIHQNPGNISDYIADHKGHLRLATTTDGVNSSVLYRESPEDEFEISTTGTFKERIIPLIFTPDNQNIYALSNMGRDKYAVVELDPKTCSEKECIFEHPEVDAETLSFSHKRNQLNGVSFVTWKREFHFLNNTAAEVYNRICDKLPDGEVYLVSKNKDEDRFIAKLQSDQLRGKFFLYDATTDQLSPLADSTPWLASENLAEMKPVSFTSSDGFTIHGYLTIPKGMEEKNLPVVVNPHGGPWYRDVWRFNPEVQFLANRGYAVFQLNFRGSTGYGRKFFESSFKQWGKKMQDDITDGVHWLIEQGIADPNRVAIYGGSYGGYATLAGMAFTPDLYACGIDFVGVSNLFTFMETIPPYWEVYLEMMYEMVGHPENDKALLEEASPVFHVDKIKSPLFVAQGANDPRVNINESDQIVNALKERGVETRYMVKDDEGHGFLKQENKFEFYREMESFLQTHL